MAIDVNVHYVPRGIADRLRTECARLGISVVASGPLPDAAREVEHAVRELGAVGAVAATSVEGTAAVAVDTR